MTMTYHDIEHDLNEEVMAEFLDPAEITAGTRTILAKVDPRDAFAVHRYAGELADAIAFERVLQDGDMVSVVSRQSAMLEEMISWLARHGTDARSLRDRRALKPSYQRSLERLRQEDGK